MLMPYNIKIFQEFSSTKDVGHDHYLDFEKNSVACTKQIVNVLFELYISLMYIFQEISSKHY